MAKSELEKFKIAFEDMEESTIRMIWKRSK